MSQLSASSRLKMAARRVLPDPAMRRIGRALGWPLPQEIDLAPLELIRSAPLERLGDAAHLEHELLPALGLSGDSPGAYPEHLRGALGRGLRHWQLPIQFGPYLAHISRMQISSYLEVGVQHGGTFAITVELLARHRPVTAAVAVDIEDAPSMHAYSRMRPGVTFAKLDSRTAAFREMLAAHGPFDLAFIDGDHSYEACRHDFETLRSSARAIAFHDIVDTASPGVRQVWAEVRAGFAHEYDFFEFAAQYDPGAPPALGIGLAVPRA